MKWLLKTERAPYQDSYHRKQNGMTQSLEALGLQPWESTWVRIQATAGPWCGYELRICILGPSTPTSLRLRLAKCPSRKKTCQRLRVNESACQRVSVFTDAELRFSSDLFCSWSTACWTKRISGSEITIISGWVVDLLCLSCDDASHLRRWLLNLVLRQYSVRSQ